MSRAETNARGGLGDVQLQDSTLESLTSAVRYHAWLRELARPHIGDSPLEIGAGLGDYAEAFLSGGLSRYTASEVEPERIVRLRARFATNKRVAVENIDLSEPITTLDRYTSVIAFNVLEHLLDDVQALENASELLAPQGAIVLIVPAHPFAMSSFDRAVGHYRRYTRKSLERSVRAAGLEVRKMHYVNAPGLFAWFLGMRLLRLVPQDGPVVRVWDRFVIPLARWVESRHRPPFGQSLFLVAARPDVGRNE